MNIEIPEKNLAPYIFLIPACGLCRCIHYGVPRIAMSIDAYSITYSPTILVGLCVKNVLC